MFKIKSASGIVSTLIMFFVIPVKDVLLCAVAELKLKLVLATSNCLIIYK